MKRAKHSLSHYKLLSCDLGSLVPIGCVEVLPGDSVQQSTNALVRAAPLLSPVMHPVNVNISHWFVPYRLIWDQFENFITGGPDGLNASVHPTINTPASTGFTVGSLADHLGVPPGVASRPVSALPFRAYNFIYNEWYRDQDLIPALVNSIASGTDTTSNTALQVGCWEKDYFTDARPWEQKGPAITIPLGTEAPVLGLGIATGAANGSTANTYQQPVGQPPIPANAFGWAPNVVNVALIQDRDNSSGTAGTGNHKPYLRADLTSASAITVNALREALALQRYEEARARYGSRYPEYLAYLGVRSSDARLNRPEYLGGGKQTIQFSEVLQTAEGTDPVGSLKGHGITSMRSNRYRRFFEEHGVVITLLTARPKTIYASGLDRMFNRRVKEDYWQKELEHIGQQEIQNKEVYFAHTTPDGIFGYNDRYQEYRRQPSKISGEFRTTLNFWHFARAFGSNPSLNFDFVKCVPTETPFAVPSENTLQVMAKHSIQARRLVSRAAESFIY